MHRTVEYFALAVTMLLGCGPTTSKPIIPSSQSQADSTPAAPNEVVAVVAEPQTARAPAASNEMLIAHNRVRVKHCAVPLRWSDKLASVAQAWANTLRDRNCEFGHSGSNYGENLAAGTSGTLSASDVVGLWYGEESLYSYQSPGFSMKTGHFTQVLWRGTTEVGCATATCNGMEITVCNYDPAGNVQSQFQENVLPQTCR